MNSAILGILLFQYTLIPYSFAFIPACYLLIKCVIFFGDFLSIIDGMIGLYIFLMIIAKIEFVSYLFIVYLALKGIVSMF